MNDNDFDIIRSVQNGNVKDYKALVIRYQGTIYNLLYQMLQQHEEAKELTQEVFIKAYENIGKFNFKSKFFSWIYRIAINTAISQMKLNKRFVSIDQLPQRMDKPFEEKMVAKERSAMLIMAIDELNEKYRDVIVRHYFEQLSYSEIAGVLEITEKKVKSRLFDARRLLKTRLEEIGYF